MASWKRTAACGEITEAQIGQMVTLNGWVNRARVQGGLAFLDLRDRSGVVQVAVDGGDAPDALSVAEVSIILPKPTESILCLRSISTALK